MRIGIDARFYGSRAKGLGRYTQKLIEYLPQVDQKNEYVIFLTKENFGRFVLPNQRFSKVLADYKWYTFSEQLFMPWKIAAARLDLMHFPHFNVPLFYHGPFVVTIHDLIITHFPTIRATTLSPWVYKIKQLAYQIVIRHAVKRALKVLSVSQFSRQEIVSYFRIAADKVVVTYEGVERRHSAHDRIDNKKILPRFQLPDRFILYVGTAYPHKNLEGLVRSFRLVIEQKKDIRLILVGKKDYFYQRLEGEIRELGLVDSVICIGEVSDQELTVLYQEALLYVFPSLCEGFGLPALEAMAQGLPAAVARIPCLLEILGEAVVYFDPYDVQDIADTLVRGIDDQQLRAELRDKGLRQTQKYSWSRMADETHALYEHILK